jgi:Zn-dependent alcohol dehydrogenase
MRAATRQAVVPKFILVNILHRSLVGAACLLGCCLLNGVGNLTEIRGKYTWQGLTGLRLSVGLGYLP